MNDKQIEKRLAANTEYWADRMAENQQKISAKNEKSINKQLRKYYRDAQEEVIDSFIRTYEKLLLAVKDGDNITPADLYNLDRYWQLQSQLKQQLQELGDKQGVLYSKKFMKQYYDIYNSISIPSAVAFSTINDAAVAQMINEIWVADGKNWSSRIWDNTNKLQQRLNDNLIDCVLTGKSTNRLKEILQEDFNVSYKQADSLVRTELAHIQTTAAQHRYKDYGIKQVQVWADEDERRCPICGKLHKEKYSIYVTMPVPVHPRCRCCIVPIVEED
jgi:SPP1 gp7 family putative phage head morphogenesis protein